MVARGARVGPDDEGEWARVQHLIDSVTPRIIALAVMSSAFTGQAIALGFDRRYGVVKRLAATALPRALRNAARDTILDRPHRDPTRSAFEKSNCQSSSGRPLVNFIGADVPHVGIEMPN